MMYGTEFFQKLIINNSLIFYGAHFFLVHSQEQIKMSKIYAHNIAIKEEIMLHDSWHTDCASK